MHGRTRSDARLWRGGDDPGRLPGSWIFHYAQLQHAFCNGWTFADLVFPTLFAVSTRFSTVMSIIISSIAPAGVASSNTGRDHRRRQTNRCIAWAPCDATIKRNVSHHDVLVSYHLSNRLARHAQRAHWYCHRVEGVQAKTWLSKNREARNMSASSTSRRHFRNGKRSNR